MKKVTLSALLLLTFWLFSACGGSSTQTINPTGPDLNLSELSALRIDQLKFTGGITDDNDGIPEPSVYIRCANNDTDIACAGEEDGLGIIRKDGVIYGRIDAAFQAVEGADANASCFDVKLVFVEKDSTPCPAPIHADDDTVWTSSVLSVTETGVGEGTTFINSAISSDDGSEIAYLIVEGSSPNEDLITPTTAQTENILRLDQVYFSGPAVDTDTNYKVVVRGEENSFRCEASFTATSSGIEQGGIIYGNLNIDLLDADNNQCLVTGENSLTSVTVSLYISGQNTPLTSDEATTLTDLVDNDAGRENLNSTENVSFNGYLRFVPIESAQ